jgi:succinyl-CoA synthetase beta subunit
VVRLAGTNVERGKELLHQSGLRIQAADTMDEGARMIVAAVQQQAA